MPQLAVPAIVGSLGGAAALGTFGVALVEIGVGFAFSQLANALFRPEQSAGPRQTGIRTEVTTAGDTTPQSMIFGRYATSGNLVAPYYSFDKDRIAEGNFRVHIIDLGDAPISSLEEILIGDTRLQWTEDFSAEGVAYNVDCAETGNINVNLGRTPTSGRYADKLFVRFLDGTQTTADPLLTGLFTNHPERPWGADKIGRGVPYVVITTKLDQEVWQSEPSFRFVVKGIEIGDPRTATVAYSDNPLLMVRNILKGIEMPDGTIWGLGVSPNDLPADWWTPALDKCEDTVEGEPRWIAGFEAALATPSDGGQTPLDVIDELLKAAAADICDLGGTWIVRSGAPELPAAVITDDDILRSKPQTAEPYEGLADSFNAVSCQWPSPQNLWNSKDAPIRVDADAEAADGERLIAELTLPAVPSAVHVQRLMDAYLKDAQRRRRHTITLPPEYSSLTPLDVIAWTSERNGYISKVFEIAEVAVDPLTLVTTIAVRERDASDYDWSPEFLLPDTAPSTTVVIPVSMTVAGFQVQPVSIEDASGGARRPAIRLSWLTDLPHVRALEYQVRVQATGSLAGQGSYTDVEAGSLIVSEGILPGVTYEVRARYDTRRPRAWTGWISVTAPLVKLGEDDLDDLINAKITEALEQIVAARAEARDTAEAQLAEVLGRWFQDRQAAQNIAAVTETITETIIEDRLASASRLLAIEAELETGFRAEITRLDEAIATETSARATSIATLTASVDLNADGIADNAAGLVTVNEAIVTETNARISSFNTLAAAIDTNADGIADNVAAIVAANQAIVDESSARATAISNLTARIDDADADILNLQTVKVDASGAIAAVSGEVSASFGSLTAWASATTFAKATADAVVAGHIWEVVGGSARLVSVSGSSLVPASEFRVTAQNVIFGADRFKIRGNSSDNAIFEVLGSSTTRNGVTRPAGVYVEGNRLGAGTVNGLATMSWSPAVTLVPNGSNRADYAQAWVAGGYDDALLNFRGWVCLTIRGQMPGGGSGYNGHMRAELTINAVRFVTLDFSIYGNGVFKASAMVYRAGASSSRDGQVDIQFDELTANVTINNIDWYFVPLLA